jgi:hypothetical protein
MSGLAQAGQSFPHAQENFLNEIVEHVLATELVEG